jgi:CRISPR system Cascade subunit CasA
MNLLTEPIFRVETPGGISGKSLPALLEALGQDSVLSLPGLQRHQEDAFHIFLCYLAGAVLVREGREEPCQDETFWREGIRLLTRASVGEDDCAWTLVVDDPTKPAFMQGPVPTKADFSSFRPKALTPDELDVLPTAKNHDVKISRVGQPTNEDWAYALISLQTMSGFFGQGNYGIARMNGGFGSRLLVTVGYRSNTVERWSRDTRRLLALRPQLLSGPWGYSAEGRVLTWLLPWDFKSSLDLSSLDPFFIEIARAVRLVDQNGHITTLGAPTKVARLAAKDANGMLGDPWTPINCKKEAALTVPASGFTPELLRDLIFEDGFQLSAMQRPDAGHEGGSCQFQASVLVRGQGTTDGFHATAVRIPAKMSGRVFGGGPERDRLGKISKTALTDAGDIQKKVLKPAVLSLLQAGPDKMDWDKREVSAWWKETATYYGETWGNQFFRWLWSVEEEESEEAARNRWLTILQNVAEHAFENAIARYPAREGRRYRARVRAECIFHGSLYKVFPNLQKKNNHDDTNHECDTHTV